MNAAARQLGRDFTIFLTGELLTLLCIGIWNVGLSWWIAVEGGARDLSIYGITLSLASIFFTLVLSPFGDRYNRRTVILFSRAALLIAGFSLAVMSSNDCYRIELVLLIVVLGSAAMAVVLPACAAAPPDLVPAEKLPLALSLQKSAQATGRALGPAMAGSMLAIGDVSIAFWAMVAMGAISAGSTLSIGAFGLPHASERKHWLLELGAGLRVKWLIPVERYWSILSLIFFSAFLPATGMLLPLQVKHLQLSGGWYGLVDVGYAAGLVFGFGYLTSNLNKLTGKALAGAASLFAVGIAFFATAFVTSPALLAATFFVAGTGFAVHNLNGQTARTLAIPPRFRVRLMSINVMLYQVASGAGAALAGLLLTAQPTPSPVYLICGATIAVVAIAFPLIPGYRQLLELHHEEADCFYQRHYPDLFRDH